MNFPIDTRALFAPCDAMLISVLRSLQPAQWNLRTVSRTWTVRDIAAHLLDGNFRVISMYRDGFSGPPPPQINSYQELVNYLDMLNKQFVETASRFSTGLIVDLLEMTGKTYSELITSLDPAEQAIFSVAWAGEETSLNWFHVAREFTEKMHHQLQIRDAIGQADELVQSDLFEPFLYTLLMGLPHHFRDVQAEQDDIIQINIDGGSLLQFLLTHRDSKWVLSRGITAQAKSIVTITKDIAWKLFTKGISTEEAIRLSEIEGDQQAGKKIFSLTAVMG